MSKADVCYEYIVEKIITGEFPPLSTLSETELQEKLHTSRTPVREAILRLSELGFVYIYSQKATLVSEVSVDLINELYTVRLINEPHIYKVVANIIDPNLLLSIKEQFLANTDHLSEDEKITYYAKLDNKLHESLLDCFNNRFILNIMRKVYIHNRRLRQLSPKPSSIAEHVAIIDAILSKDDSAIEKVTIEHIENSRQLSLSAREHGFFNKRNNVKCQI